MKKIIFFSGLFSTLALVSCGGKKQNSITLTLNLEKGQQFQTEATVKQKIESNMMGQTTTIDQTFLTTYLVSVEDINPSGNYIIRNTYKRIRFEQSIAGLGDMGNTVVDTEKPDENKGMAAAMTAPLMQSLIGKSFTSEVDKQGKTLNIDMSELAEQGATNQADNSLSNYNISFPNKPIKIGDSWEEEKELKTQNASMKVKMKHTIKSIDQDVVEIESTGTIGPVNPGDKIKGTQNSTTKINLKNGWSSESKINQELEMEIVQDEQSIPMKIKSEITVISK